MPKKIFTFLRLFLLLSIVLFFSCNKEVTGPQPIKENKTGLLVISSKPEGAKIFLNSFNTGKVTPDSIAALDSGSYKIVLKSNTWLDTAFTVQLKPGKKENLFCDYTVNPKNFASIECISDPTGADIIMNDSLTGKSTPYTFQFLNPGNYKITTRFQYYRVQSQNVNIETGERKTLNFVMQDTSVWVDYNISNSGFPINNVNCLYSDYFDLWIGTQGAGLIRNKGGTRFEVFNKDNSPLPENNITKIKRDRKETIWILCESNVATYSNGTFTNLKKEEIDPAIVNFIDIAFTNEDNYPYILATVKKQSSTVGRVYKYFAEKWTMLLDDLPNPQAIETDHDDRLWISANGLMIFSESYIYKDYSENSPLITLLPQVNIVKIKYWYGLMYIGANYVTNSRYGTGGLYTYSNGVFKNYILPSRSITSFDVTTDGEVWISLGAKIFKSYINQAGVIDYFNGSATMYDLKSTKIPFNNCMDITKFQNDIYIATWGDGLVKFKTGK